MSTDLVLSTVPSNLQEKRLERIVEEEVLAKEALRLYLLSIERMVYASSLRQQRAESRREYAREKGRLRNRWCKWRRTIQAAQNYIEHVQALRLSFKNHEFHSAHGARYYYVTPHGAYSTRCREDCLGARRNTTPQYVSRRRSSWVKSGGDVSQLAPEVPGVQPGTPGEIPAEPQAGGGLYRRLHADASGPADLPSDGIPRSSAPFLFVICKTASIYFDLDMLTESRCAGANEVYVVRSFEEAVDAIVSGAELVISFNNNGVPVASEAEEKRRSEEQEESEMRAKRVAHLLATRRGTREAARSESNPCGACLVQPSVRLCGATLNQGFILGRVTLADEHLFSDKCHMQLIWSD
ncbi:hypothetical protein B0H13DRAFT_1874502 [Mycena leptocephala]|nr:hypothetical protein B0H13DRAFT_1874502 [Mycena leptocephala]